MAPRIIGHLITRLVALLCRYRLSPSPTVTSVMLVAIVNASGRVPRGHLALEVCESFGASGVDVTKLDDEHLQVAIVFPPALPHFADTLS
jgi:hypothetical protein